MDIANEARRHQQQAAFHAYEAQHAVRALLVANRSSHADLARHHQAMAKFHAERAWVFLLSLLLRDPII